MASSVSCPCLVELGGSGVGNNQIGLGVGLGVSDL